MSPEDQGRLIRRLLAQESAAWTELVDGYGAFLWAVTQRTFCAYGYSFSAHDVEDALSAVWRNLLERDNHLLKQCLKRGGLLQLLQVLTRHRAIDLMRRHRNNLVPLEMADMEVEAGESSPPPDLADYAYNAAALKVLTPRERTCVRLFYIQGRKYRDIASLTGISINSIGPTLQRALEKLKREITAVSPPHVRKSDSTR